MRKFRKENLHSIKSMIRDRTGVQMGKTTWHDGGYLKKSLLAAAGVLCCFALSAFAYYKFNSLDGDELSLRSVYQGGGRYEIYVTNLSAHELKLQDEIRVMQWSTGQPVEGDPGRIRVEAGTIAPGGTGVVKVDLSDGYDVERMKESIGDGDWYYFVLTNNAFAFGQDWMCTFDFGTGGGAFPDPVLIKTETAGSETQEPAFETGGLIFEDWASPLSALSVSGHFGEQANGAFSDHVSFAGKEGDPVFAVSDGTVAETGFDKADGIYVVLSVEDGICVKYGHLQEAYVSEGETVSKGDQIAAVGKTGMATGANLAFAVNMGGEYIDPVR